jgi:uncharacterized membrane-anchored protein
MAEDSKKNPSGSKEGRVLTALARDITAAIRVHESTSKDLLRDVETRLANLEKLAKMASDLQRRLETVGVSKETEELLRKMRDDIKANLRLTASIKVPLQRGPSMKNYSLMAKE